MAEAEINTEKTTVRVTFVSDDEIEYVAQSEGDYEPSEVEDMRVTRNRNPQGETPTSTPKSILKRSKDADSAETPRGEKPKRLETTTPYRLRVREDEENAASSDEDSASSEEENEEDERSEDEEEVKPTTKKPGLPTMAERVEHFFHMNTEKSVTSDRTLAKLETPRMDAKSLLAIMSEIQPLYKKERIELYKKYSLLFPKWMLQLCSGRNILLHGLGSKRPLLELFRTKMVSEYPHLVVNGYFPSLTLKHILSGICEDVLELECGQAVPDMQAAIIDYYKQNSDEDFFLIFNNIDGEMLRGEKTQATLSVIANVPNIHVIASIDHINASLIWDQAKFSRFRWIWYDVTTYESYTEETSYENSLLVQQSGVLALSSLRHVMRSLTPNAREIFFLLARYQLDQANNSSYIGLAFPDLYNKCRQAFLVNSNLTLKAQLTEFRDHKLIKSKKGPDGTEHLSIPLDDATLKEYMDNNEG